MSTAKWQNIAGSKKFFIVSSIQCSIIRRGNFYDDLAGFCSNNGFIFLSLTTTNDYPPLHYNARHAFEAFQKHNLRVRRLSYTKSDVINSIVYCAPWLPYH